MVRSERRVCIVSVFHSSAGHYAFSGSEILGKNVSGYKLKIIFLVLVGRGAGN